MSDGSVGKGPGDNNDEPLWLRTMPASLRKSRDAAIAAQESEADKLLKVTADAHAGLDKQLEASKNNLEAARLRVFGGRERKAGTPLIGVEGLKLRTDVDLEMEFDLVDQWIVKNVIPTNGVGALYGDSGTFKSFLALDLLAAIATGREAWFGYRIKRTPCVYVPFEGKGGIPKRVAAWRLAMAMRDMRYHPDGNLGSVPNFAITTGIHYVMDPLNLRNAEDRQKLVDLLRANGLEGCVLCIDTLSQAGHGIDENKSEDMGEMINIFQELQRSLKGVVLPIHHTGKDLTRGMRGHSSLRAALDFAIEVSKPDDAGKYEAQMKLDKVKDEESGTIVPFSMRLVALGADDDGDLITSLVVALPHDVTSSAAPEPEQDHSPAILSLIDEFYRSEVWISTSLTKQAKNGVYHMLKDQESYPRGLSFDKLIDLVKNLQLAGKLKVEGYKRPNRTHAERWKVM